AVAQFKQVLTLPQRDKCDATIKELTHLSLGRVFFEMGKFDDAIAEYSQIDSSSDSFVDSLYETAWAQVRKREYHKAKDLTEYLMPPMASASVVTPDAQILEGTPLLKLQQYDDATQSFTRVINDWQPVEDDLNSRLANPNPDAYFDQVLKSSSFDIKTVI